MESGRILVVDDEKKIVGTLTAYLERDGYEVIHAYDGETALELFAEKSPDLVILDVMLPGLDGLSFCRRVREGSTAPIIMLSARSEEADKLLGLELGADDYVTKPFSPRELVARVGAVLRRSRLAGGSGPGSAVVRGPMLVDASRHLVEVDGREVALTATEFGLLAGMASRPGQVFSRRQLLEMSQGEFYEGYERTVDTHVKNIRKKLKEAADEWEFIDTVHGVGYRFAEKRKA